MVASERSAMKKKPKTYRISLTKKELVHVVKILGGGSSTDLKKLFENCDSTKRVEFDGLCVFKLFFRLDNLMRGKKK